MNNEIQLACSNCKEINNIPESHLTDQLNCVHCKKAIFTDGLMTLNDGCFADVIANTNVPIVVDFWAHWCGPCKTMVPAFAEAAKQLFPNVILVKMNVELAKETANKFEIRSLPTLVIFKNGQSGARRNGAMSTAQIVEWIEENIQNS